MAKDPDLVVYSIGGRKYVGWKEVAEAMQEEFDAAERLDITITDLHVWQHGDVAWFAMELNYNRPEGSDEGQRPIVLALRDTGVLERRKGAMVVGELARIPSGAPRGTGNRIGQNSIVRTERH